MFKEWCSRCSITLYYFIDKLIKPWYIAIFDKKKRLFFVVVIVIQCVHYYLNCAFFIIKNLQKNLC